MNQTQFDAIIIGAGVSGLALSVRLRNQGLSVLVIERNDYVGGKLAQTTWNGYTWDNGPSVFTLPEFIDDLFIQSNKNPRDYFNYTQHSTSCQYFFPSGRRLTIPFDKKKLKEVIKDAYCEKDANDYLAYLESSKNTWDRIGEFFLSRPQFTAKDLLKGEMIKRYPFFLTRPMRKTLHNYNTQKLENEELVLIADRYSTYIGSNPYKMAGIYSLIGHVEQNIGTYFPENGMRQIPESIHKLSLELGAEYIISNNELKVTDKDKGKGYSVLTDKGSFGCDKLICGIDHLQFYKNIYPNVALFKKFDKQERSATALVFYWAVNKEFKELDLHNIFFSDDYKGEFKTLTEDQGISSDPTVYVHISSIAEKEQAPEGCQNWFVMVNAPAHVFWTDEEIKQHKSNILKKLKSKGIDVEPHIEHEKYWSSKDIRDKTGGYHGALYGAASNSLMAPMNRHPNKLKEFDNLYFCGGTAHPGGGIPQALKSAEIVAKHIQRES